MTGADRSYGVRVSVDGEDRGEQPFGWNFDPASPLRGYIAKVENGTCAVTDIREIGSRLLNTLCPASRNLRDGPAFVDCALDEPLAIRLEIPTERELERLPWEALEDERLGRLLGNDERYTFARLPASDAPEAAARPKDRTAIRVLVVVPEGSGLRTRYEIQNLQALAARLPDQLEVKVLDGRVTLQRLQQALREGYCDVLHYIGHGEVGADAGVTIRFNDDHDAERMVDAFTFAQILAVSAIQLAVLNCCSGESPSISKSLLGLGPHLTRTAQIPAVVAMRYEIAPETDHDDLDDQLDRLSKEIADLFDQSARAVVFLGVSPRDPAVRRMCRKLLKITRRHMQGPRYFVGADSSAVDRAYWERFRVRWIDRPLHEVLPALTAAATEEPR